MRTAICGHLYADVAQLVEQGFRKAKVGGSSPSIGTIPPFHNLSECTGSNLLGFRIIALGRFAKKISLGPLSSNTPQNEV